MSEVPDWARYWRADGMPVEAMHAHFTAHVYHRHSHESYSFGPGAYRAATHADAASHADTAAHADAATSDSASRMMR
jgi:hypothetical protein